MEKKIKSLLIVFTIFISSASFAYMDQKCLNDCFCTNHECDYCRWMCDKNPPNPPIHYDLNDCSRCELCPTCDPGP